MDGTGGRGGRPSRPAKARRWTPSSPSTPARSWARSSRSPPTTTTAAPRASSSSRQSEGTIYRIAVDAFDGDTGNFELAVRLAPPNDDFDEAAELAGDSGNVGGLTIGASIELDEPEHYYDEGFPSVWYRWTAPTSGWATFETCGVESVVAVYSGSALVDLTEVASDGYGCWPGARVSFEATGGSSYFVAVAGAYGFESEFTLVWNRNPPPPEPPYAIDYPRVPTTAKEGETLTAADGEWRGATPIAFAYEWGRCDRDFECRPIDGAHARSYVPTAGDVGQRLFVRVTASNVAGSSVEYSNLTTPVAARPPLNMVVPFVSGTGAAGRDPRRHGRRVGRDRSDLLHISVGDL